MFLPFRISVDTIDRLTSPSPLRSIRFDKCEENAKDILLSSIDLATGVISGETLKNGWLPVDENYHVFISYSRDDKSKAEKLANWLTSHGVKCFLDSYYWNNADDLLKAIDDKWCKDKDGYYNYRNRNYTSSLIHAMLSMAIMEAISRCDFGIFIESGNSVDLDLSDISTFTLSPWIYEELHMMTIIEKRVPSWLKKERVRLFSSDTGVLVESAPPVRMSFEIPRDELVEIDYYTLTHIKGAGDDWMYNLYKEYDGLRTEFDIILDHKCPV